MTLDLPPPLTDDALLNWKLQLPVDKDGGRSPFDPDGNRVPILEVRNLVGYGCPFTYPAPDGPLRYYELREDLTLVLGTPVDGLTTSGALYARTELREMAGATNATWSLSDGGALTVRMRVDQLPERLSGGTAPIVIGQIASTQNDQLARLYYANGSVYWVNGANEARPDDAAYAVMDLQAGRPAISLGETFTYGMQVKDDVVVLTVEADGITYRSGIRIGPGWDGDERFYFKAGVYLGAGPATATGWGQIAISGLGLSHEPTGPLALPPSPLPEIAGAVSDNGLEMRLRGTTGDDLFVVSRTGTTVNARAGFDTVYSIATWTMSPDVERLVLMGSEPIKAFGRPDASSVMVGNGAANEITGGTGDDRLTGGGGVDLLRGGAGDDVYEVDGWTEPQERPDEGTDTVRSRIGMRLGENLEVLELLGTRGLRGVGNGLANTILGTAGGDTLVGGQGIDVLRGGLGDDLYVVDAKGEAREAADAGHDRVRSLVDYRLGDGIEDLDLRGPVAVSGVGNALANVITGTGAGNTLDGRGGLDVLRGGRGNDTYVVDAPGEAREAPNEGVDTVRSGVSYMLGPNFERLVLLGSADLTGTGNAQANLIVGNDGANTLDGRGGADELRGGRGDDLYLVDRAGEAIENRDSGTDKVRSPVGYELGPNLEDLELTGPAGARATGNWLDNRIVGNAGANRIAGKGGNDLLTGGGGRDVFVFDTAPNAQTNQDRILDMNPAGEDRIALAAEVFKALAPGPLPERAFEANAIGQADSAGDRIVYDIATGDLLYDSNGSAPGGTQVVFARLAPGLFLGAEDFLVF